MSMNKSRQGSALVMALVVVLVGSGLTAIIFNIAFRYAWVGTAERAGFIDHTTVLDCVQKEIAKILQTNMDAPNNIVVRSEAVWQNRQAAADGQALPNSPLSVNDLIISREQFDVSDGVGRRNVRVTVLDMTFNPAWLDWGAMTAADLQMLPPAFRLLGGSTGGWGEDGNMEAPWSDHNPNDPPDAPLNPGIFGAYLVRVELFNTAGGIVRMAEEAFVQTMPAPAP